ncbi:Histone H2B [Fasciola gigantica]|uniref:Histone H2B n=1 Tax=Fasciola gigantica TaxID=46835 RepID=A0A504YXT7_FASGI|nr:Histone H2B [Fasciola gigantica]
MLIMNSFVTDISECIAAESSRLAHYNKRSTIKGREVQTAVRLLLHGRSNFTRFLDGVSVVIHSTNLVNFVLYDIMGDGELS